MERNSFVFYKEWMEAIKDLPDDVRLEIYEGIIEYAITGNVQGLTPMAKVAFNFMKMAIDNDIQKRPLGAEHWNWKGGISEENHKIRTSSAYRAWVHEVFERDNYTCQKCGQTGVPLNAHHIQSFAKYPELRLVLSNGITLCKPCHIQEHSTQ